MKKVVVGSKNPVKIESVRLAFEKIFPDGVWEISGIDVQSGVSSQPMSDLESIQGARIRAKNAMKELSAEFAVGLEGGLQQIEGNWFNTGWVVILDKEENEGIGSTISMIVPPVMMQMIHEGKELGYANDELFKTTNTKQGNGHFGHMTKNAITRTGSFQEGVISALARFITPQSFSR